MGAENRAAASDSSRKPVKISAREAYRLWARTYDDDFNPIVSLIDRHLEIPAGVAIDVACGTGRWVERTGGFGVDLSIEMLVRRRGRVAQADALRLPFRDGIADVVLCILALGYIEPAEAAIEEMHRIARQGGAIIVGDIAAGFARTFRAGDVVYEIENRPYRPEGAMDLYFGDPERAIYESAGKAKLFEEVRHMPAAWMKRWTK